MDDLVKALDMSGVSKSQVSRLCAELDERIGAFLNRRMEGDRPSLWIDPTYVNTDGQREVLGLKVGASEAEPFCGDHDGENAIAESFQAAGAKVRFLLSPHARQDGFVNSGGP